MKKQVYILVLAALFVATGCNAGSKEAKANEPEAKATPAAAPSSNNTPGKAIHLTKAEFLTKVMNYEKNPDKWVYLGDKPCIIDFYADWCRPCKIAAPILDEIAMEYKNDIYVYKINTEVERELAAAFGIQSIPAFLFCPMGENPQMQAGIGQTNEQTKQMFKSIVDEFLLKKK